MKVSKVEFITNNTTE